MDNDSIHILAQLGKYNGKLLSAKLEETHISWILLSGELVFKIKKPVKLSFLDFSELSARKSLCEKELMLNKRFSPIYLDVLPVRQHEDGFEVGNGNGAIVDYTVVMKRQLAEARMDLMLSQGKIGSGHIIALAEEIATLHRDAPIVQAPFDQQQQMATFNDIQTVRPFISRYASSECVKIVDDAIAFGDAFIHRYADRMKERVRLGFKRDVHGDLHSGNIFIAEKPIIFDCIEYNDAFRQIDVLSDIAFLCMDLEAFGQQSLSEIFLSIYCEQFPAFQNTDDDLIFLYYKCLRANIRAKVNAVSAIESTGSPSFEVHLKAAEKYLHLMNDYLVQMQG
jgi:hypothetical protein